MTASKLTQSKATTASEVRLVEVLDAYMAAAQEGRAPTRDDLLAEHPELAEDLEACLASLEFIGRASLTAAPLAFDSQSAESSEGEPGIGDLGDFRLIAEIGRGGMGVVYEAVQRSLNRRVALKVLPFAAAMDPTQLRRFQTEALAAAQLHHTNIVPVYSVGCERGVHYYAMQFIEGQTLAQAIAERRAIDVTPHGQGGVTETIPSAQPTPSSRSKEYLRMAAELGIQAAEALDHAHKFGIVHRDIKPANLLVDIQGSLWVTDFGLARLQDDAGLTITGDLLGTLRYMSPEQALAKRGYLDHRSDIYSLGATFYELVTLLPAIDGQDRQEVLRKIAHDEPSPPRRVNPSIPRELETILLKALAKEPESRYATAQELAEDLRRFLDDKPIRAKRASLFERAAKWSRRHATVVRAAVLVLLVAAFGLAASNRIIARRNAEISRKNDEIVRQARQITRALHQSDAARKQAEEVSRFLMDAFQRPDPDRDGRELKVVDLFTSAAARLDKEFANSPKIKGDLLDALGATIDKLGLPMQAADILEKAFVVRKTTLGPDHSDTLATQNRLGEACLAAGRTARALALFEALLMVRQATVGPDHSDTLECQSNLAMAFARMGDLIKAIPLFERTLQAQRSHCGLEHFSTLTTQNNLASTLADAGRNNEALVLFDGVLKGYEATLGPDHSATLRGRNNLAFALTRVGRIPEAIRLLETTLKKRESKLGPDHPHTVNSLTNLAVAYNAANQPARAMPLVKLALERKRGKLGPDHPETLGSQIFLGRIYQNTGHAAEAARLLEDALLRARGRPDAMKVAGPASRYLHIAYYDSRQYAKLETYSREALEDCRKSFGPEDNRTVTWMCGLGLALVKQHKWSEAEPILRESSDILQKTAPDAWARFACRSALGESLLGMGRYAEAELLIVTGYEALKAREATILPEHKSRVTEAAERVVRLYIKLKQPEKSRSLVRSEDLDAMMPNGAAAFASGSVAGEEEASPED